MNHILVLTLLLSSFCLLPLSLAADAPKPNIILILADDPGESKHLAATMPDTAKKMSGILASHLKSVNAESHEAPTAAKKKKNPSKNEKAGVK